MTINNRDRLIDLIGVTLDQKQNKIEVYSGFLGTVINGRQFVKVPNRSGFVYVRLNGNDSEIIQAFNDKVPFIYGLKVLVQVSQDNANYYMITGKDISVSQNWPNTDPFLPKHAYTHSMGDGIGAGTDPVFIYKKQLLQPMGVRPVSVTGSSFVYVEADFYEWNGVTKRFPGKNTVDLSIANPVDNSGRYLVIALNGDTNDLNYFTGTTFSIFPLTPTGTLSFIPNVDTASAIPLAAIYLTSGTNHITWDKIYDLRNFLNEGGISAATVYNYTTGSVMIAQNGGTFIGPRKKLNFKDGTNTTVSVVDNPALQAIDITINGAISNSGGTGGHLHGLTRWNVVSGTTVLQLPDLAEYIDSVFFNGFLYDPFEYILNTGSAQIIFSNPLNINGIITANYVIRQI